ncbi:condensation domain-containing protein [Catellatospora citrea]|nr:condensation domain-containing protein [Catellatospora citrea]RKE05526.1 phosphopantetheine binding protein [Catellatospora citrea]
MTSSPVRYRATTGQWQMWLAHQDDPTAATYNIAYGWRLSGDLDAGALSAAVDALVARHDTLRTTFDVSGDALEAVVGPPPTGVLQLHDLTSLPPDSARARLAADTDRLAHEPFDLDHGPVLRAHLFLICPGAAFLLLCVHHVAFDSGSEPALVRDLSTLYRGQNPTRPARPGPEVAALVRDAAAGIDTSAALTHWRGVLAGASPCTPLPLDRRREQACGDHGGRVPFVLAADEAHAVRDACRRLRVTPFVLLLAAHVFTLSTWSGESDLVTGVPVMHRDDADLEDVVGTFVSSLPVRIRLDGVTDTDALVARVRDVVIDLMQHRGVALPDLVRELAADRLPGVHPIFQSMFSFSTVDRPALRLAQVSATAQPILLRSAKFDLTVEVEQHGTTLRGAVEYHRGLFDEATIEALRARLLRAVRAIAAERPTGLAELAEPAAARVAAPARPAAPAAPPASDTVPEPADPIETSVAAAFAQALGLDRLDPATAFFHEGGDSLAAALLAVRLTRQLGVQVSAKDVFRAPTATALAALLRTRRPATAREPIAAVQTRQEARR